MLRHCCIHFTALKHELIELILIISLCCFYNQKLPNLCSWLCRVALRVRLCQVLRIFCVVCVGFGIFFTVSQFSHNTDVERSPVLISGFDVTHGKANDQHPIYKFGSQEPEMSPEFRDRAYSFKNIPHSSKSAESQVLRDASSKHLKIPQCPLDPPGLVGLLKPIIEDTNPQKLRTLFPEMEKGGRIRPANCTARQRLAIIVPFRNRHPHLHILLRNLIPFLRKQMADATIFIIEQAPPTTFNRGALLNIGFLEALKTAEFDCFLLHDVDMVPLNDRNFYRCGDNPRHFAAAINKNRFIGDPDRLRQPAKKWRTPVTYSRVGGAWQYLNTIKLRYKYYVGGVVGFSKEQYIKVNGNSNLYFGWGGEDDDLAWRIGNKTYKIDRYDNMTSRYLMIRHERDEGNDKNTERRHIMKSSSRRQDVEGVNSIKYKVNSVKLGHLYTWINVSLNMTEILDTAPEYTKRDMRKLLRELHEGRIQR